MTASAEKLLAHPRFAEARKAYIDGYLGLYSGEPVLSKLLLEGARHVIITFVVCLSAGQREDAPATWLTLGKLQDDPRTASLGGQPLMNLTLMIQF